MPEPLTILFAFAAGLVALAGLVGIVWWFIKPRVQEWMLDAIRQPMRDASVAVTANSDLVEQIHHQLSVNNHSSEKPTMLDRFDDIEGVVQGMREDLQAVRGDLQQHILWHLDH